MKFYADSHATILLSFDITDLHLDLGWDSLFFENTLTLEFISFSQKVKFHLLFILGSKGFPLGSWKIGKRLSPLRSTLRSRWRSVITNFKTAQSPWVLWIDTPVYLILANADSYKANEKNKCTNGMSWFDKESLIRIDNIIVLIVMRIK